MALYLLVYLGYRPGLLALRYLSVLEDQADRRDPQRLPALCLPADRLVLVILAVRCYQVAHWLLEILMVL